MAMIDGIGGAANPCRRRILAGLSALMAGAGLPPAAAGSDLGPHDQTILYLKRRLDAAASAMAQCTGRRQAILFRGLSAHASALALTPAHRASCIAIKREVAEWTFSEGDQTICLPAGLVRDLLASALRDECRSLQGQP